MQKTSKLTEPCAFVTISLMKGIGRRLVLSALSLYLVSQLFPTGLVFVGGIVTLSIAAIVLTLLSLVIKPILKILSSPLTVITFGIFNFVVNGSILWLLTFLVKQALIRPFTIPGISIAGFVVPKIPIHSIILAYIVIAAGIAGIQAGFSWLMQE